MGDRRQLHSDATTAAARIRETGKAEPPLVEPLILAVRLEKGQARRRRFWAARLVASLTDHAEIREAVRQLAAADAWHLRYRAMRCLDVNSPRPFATEVLKRGLLDSHPRVRTLAACMAGSLLLTELVEDLIRYRHAYPTESEWFGRYWLPLLRDGYSFDDRCKDPLLLRVAHGRQIVSRHVTREELSHRGIAAIVAEMQGQP